MGTLDYTIDCNNSLFPTVKQRFKVQSDNARRITEEPNQSFSSAVVDLLLQLKVFMLNAYEYAHSIIRNIWAIKKSGGNSGVIVSVALCYFQWLCNCRTGCCFLAACTRDRKQFQLFSTRDSGQVFTHPGNSFGHAGMKTGRFRCSVSSDLRYVLFLRVLMETHRFPERGDSLPAELRRGERSIKPSSLFIQMMQ